MKANPAKLKNFQTLLKRRKIGAFAVLDNATVNYLTDFMFNDGASCLLVTPNKAYCFTKELFAITLRRAAPFLTLVDSLSPAGIAALAKKLKIKNPVFDPGRITYLPGNLLKAAGFGEDATLITAARQQKQPVEQVRIKKACQISAAAYPIFRKKLKTGMSELAAAQMLEGILASLGGQGLAFETIACFGPNTADPHHTPSATRKLKANEPVLIDYGCRVGGYCSDITRTFWHGGKPGAEFAKIFDIVKSAHDVCIKTVKPGLSGAQADALCRDYIERAQKGLSKRFIHTTGHGLGLQIHEAPRVGMGSQDILQAGTIFTVEPGLYFAGKFGIRYEDTVLLTPKGAKILTK